MSKTKLFLFIFLFISIAINIRFFIVFTKAHDDRVITISKALNIEIEVLELLEKGDTEVAKSTLSKEIAHKTMYLSICLAEKCISNEAILKISAKP